MELKRESFLPDAGGGHRRVFDVAVTSFFSFSRTEASHDPTPAACLPFVSKDGGGGSGGFVGKGQ